MMIGFTLSSYFRSGCGCGCRTGITDDLLEDGAYGVTGIADFGSGLGELLGEVHKGLFGHTDHLNGAGEGLLGVIGGSRHSTGTGIWRRIAGIGGGHTGGPAEVTGSG